MSPQTAAGVVLAVGLGLLLFATSRVAAATIARVTAKDTPPNAQRATNLSLGAALVAFVNAIMSLVVSFGLSLSAQQQASIQGLVNSLVLLVIAGSHVYGQVTAERERWSHLDPEDK